MCPSISVIIPACDAVAHLGRCLEALASSGFHDFETIVIDDGSKDDTPEIAASFGVRVLRTEARRGPAFARNLGVKESTGSILFFLDSDVAVKPHTVEKIQEVFSSDFRIDALIGCYDSEPSSPDFLSQYRNLMHAYVHHTGAEEASTFWSGCGAIRRQVFLDHSGFSEGYGRPAIEDIELGYRLIRAGRRIMLDRTLLVTHLKRWTFWGLLKTDILDRGIPWTELILRDRFMPNDLNLQLSQRVSVALVFILLALSGALVLLSGAYLLLPLLAILFLIMARWWGETSSYRRSPRVWAMLLGTVMALAAMAFEYGMYGLIPPLTVTPVLLFMRHRYRKGGKLKKIHRWFGILYIGCSVCLAAWYLPNHHLIFACFAILALLGVMNSQFYIFLAGKRGVAFMAAAIPFHLLYHFYNGISFMVGIIRHYWIKLASQAEEDAARKKRSIVTSDLP
jgi:glycosyltransferase involved in cell wall biosynthesis